MSLSFKCLDKLFILRLLMTHQFPWKHVWCVHVFQGPSGNSGPTGDKGFKVGQKKQSLVKIFMNRTHTHTNTLSCVCMLKNVSIVTSVRTFLLWHTTVSHQKPGRPLFLMVCVCFQGIRGSPGLPGLIGQEGLKVSRLSVMWNTDFVSAVSETSEYKHIISME